MRRDIIAVVVAAVAVALIICLFRKSSEGLEVYDDLIAAVRETPHGPEKDDESVIRLRIHDGSVEVLKEPTKLKGRGDVVVEFMKRVAAAYPAISLEFPVGLEDSCSPPASIGRMIFSKKKTSAGILIPDMYSMQEYNGMVKTARADPIPFAQKKDKALFIGAITGSLNPEANQRLLLCRQSLFHGRDLEAYHTNSQIPEEDIARVFPEFKAFKRSPMPIEEQLQYRYIVSVDGNTAAWDRPVWVMASNCILIRVKSDEHCWYYPFLEKEKPYIEVNSVEDVPRAIQRARSMSKEDREAMQARAKDFVQRMTGIDSHIRYTGDLLLHLTNKTK